MEKVQALIAFKYSLFLFFVFCIFACSTKQVMEDDITRFEDINSEFAQVISIKEDETPAHSEIKKSEVKSIKKTAKRPLIAKTKKKINIVSNQSEQKNMREPSIEDNEGFAGRRPIVDPFREGEKTVYSMTYFNTEAGELSLNVEPFKLVNDRKAYHYTLTMKSSRRFALFFAIDVKTETYVDYEELVPLSYSSNSKDSSRIKEVKVYWDWEKNKGNHWEKTVKKSGKEKKRKVDWSILPYSQDVLSALFYLRNVTLIPGKTFSYRVADTGKNYVFKGEVLKKEKLDTDLGVIDTLLIKPTFELEGELKPTGENLIWVTDDDRKRIVRIEMKIKIGSLIAKVKTMDEI